jgi:phosphoribosylanthranilate isomerase
MMVKVCGITRREDAVASAEAGASAIGFIFYPKSARYVTPQAARELGDGLNLWKVGVFVNELPESVSNIVAAAKLDVAQIYGPFHGNVRQMRLWHALRVPMGGGSISLESVGCEAIFLDGSANGVSFDWHKARAVAERKKVVIAGGLNPSNVAEAIRIARPWGVDASSGLEISPGITDHEKVRQFVKAAQEAAS